MSLGGRMSFDYGQIILVPVADGRGNVSRIPP